MIESIQIRNPRVRQVVAEEVQHGAGRNFTEAAENLILDAAERRRLERDRQQRHVVPDVQEQRTGQPA